MASIQQKPTSDPSRGDISDSASDVSTESSQGWDDAQDVEEDTGDESPAICLFCKETRPSAHEIFLHAKEAHSFDWGKTVSELGQSSSLVVMELSSRLMANNSMSTGTNMLTFLGLLQVLTFTLVLSSSTISVPARRTLRPRLMKPPLLKMTNS